MQELIQAVTGTEYESLLKELESAAEKSYADYAFALDIYYYKKYGKKSQRFPIRRQGRS